MTDLAFVFQMSNHLCFAGQRPHKPAAVRGHVFLGSPHVHTGLMNIRGRLVQRINQQLNKPIHLRLIVIVIGQFECVIEEYVGWN